MLLTQPTVGSAKFATRFDTPLGSSARGHVGEDEDAAGGLGDRQLLRGFLAAPLGGPDEPHAGRQPAHDLVGAISRTVGCDDDLELPGRDRSAPACSRASRAMRACFVVRGDDEGHRRGRERLAHRTVADDRQQRQRSHGYPT